MNRLFKIKQREDVLKKYFANKKMEISRKIPCKLTEEQKNERRRKLKQIALKNKSKQSEQLKVETVEMVEDNPKQQQEQGQKQPDTCWALTQNFSWNTEIISDYKIKMNKKNSTAAPIGADKTY